MPRTRRLFVTALLALLLLPAAATAASSPPAETFGVLVMAHGGTEEWDRTVRDAVAPIAAAVPTAIAFGMADADSLQAATRELEQRGVTQIAVVRVFISGASFLERTEQIFGLRPGAPVRHHETEDGHAGDHAAHGGSGHGDGHGTDARAPAGHSMALYRLHTEATFALSAEGLAEAPEVDRILLDRARALSVDAPAERVLLLAHGTGDEKANERWRALIRERAALMEREMSFSAVTVETLAEDWAGPRADAEVRIREFVEGAAAAGERALVIPFRLSGFGPYAEVLDGLDYTADGLGLLPHAAITAWIERQVDELRAGRFRAPLPVAGTETNAAH